MNYMMHLFTKTRVPELTLVSSICSSHSGIPSTAPSPKPLNLRLELLRKHTIYFNPFELYSTCTVQDVVM